MILAKIAVKNWRQQRTDQLGCEKAYLSSSFANGNRLCLAVAQLSTVQDKVSYGPLNPAVRIFLRVLFIKLGKMLYKV